jgi:hypothetical protein
MMYYSIALTYVVLLPYSVADYDALFNCITFTLYDCFTLCTDYDVTGDKDGCCDPILEWGSTVIMFLVL